MTRGRKRVHYDATGPGAVLRAGLCGWLDVDTETDVSRVTCMSCLTKLRGARNIVVEAVAEAVATLEPTAPAPPQLTPPLWAVSCKGGEHRRCGDCDLCVWEREAEMWNAVSPWNAVKRRGQERPENAARWPSLGAAFSALIEFEAHDRCSPSALGGILDRIRLGTLGDANSGNSRPDDPLLRRAGELVRIRQALELAFPEGAHALSAIKCRALLVVRTPGVAAEMPSYEILSVMLEQPAGELQALVRAGRRIVVDDLAARGLIPTPRPQRRSRERSTHYAEAAE